MLSTSTPTDLMRTSRHRFSTLHTHSTAQISALQKEIEIVDHYLQKTSSTLYSKATTRSLGPSWARPWPHRGPVFSWARWRRTYWNSPRKIDADCWKRFIDDILILWMGTQEELDTFTTFINSLHHLVKFTVNSSRT